ncbi:MAG TPA: hypothetical protein VEC94_06355 [Pseudolabrys sp.]|nr:hypothetical protein [Pseudolabrys sp.]
MKLATRSAAAALMGANRGFSILTVRVRPAVWPSADPGVLHKGFGSFAWPSADLLEGAVQDLKRPGPERGTTGTLTISNNLHTVQNQYWQAKL